MSEGSPKERIYDEDRLTGRRLTPDELESLRRRSREKVSIAREAFRRTPL